MASLRLQIAFALGAITAAGCSGEIAAPGADGSGPGAGTGSSTSSSGGSGAGTSAAGGATGSGGEGGSGAGAAVVPSDPGYVVMRRLNRTEYNNTVRDLLDTPLRPADEFPADDLGGEFDTVGTALSLSPTYVIQYERAAHALVDDLFAADAERRERIITCDVAEEGDTCARSILSAFARRAWRRPVTELEVDSLMLPLQTAGEIGASPTEGLRHALAAVLLSPYFLFKIEADPNPIAGEQRRLTSHELATRLSYAIWSTTPDDALLSAADADELSTDQQVAAHVDRMLDDPRSDALVDSFASRWLEFQHLERHEVEADLFPEYSADLALAMKEEARLFIQEFLSADLPVTQMLTAPFTFVNEELAEHYDLPAPTGGGGELQRVDTTGTERAGLLTLGALLTHTSFSSRTSPVRRGEFVFSRMLCGTVPPPPPGVEGEPAEVDGLTFRQRLELHRKDPACAGCHTMMDPIGFGLEQYDGIGRFRTHEGDAPIDASGEFEGKPFSGAIELGAVLATDARVPECVTQKFMTFAVGRLMTSSTDQSWVAHITNQALAEGGSLRDVVRTVLLSEPFRSRRPPTM